MAAAVFGPGDEVITHAPGWPTIVEQAKLAGATPVVVRAHPEDGFALNANDVRRRHHAADARHRHQLAGQPHRRADGRVGDGSAGRRGRRARPLDSMDFCYEKLSTTRCRMRCRGSSSSGLKDRSALCGSTSKAYAMTGWRCGWVAGSQSLVGACNALQSHTTSNVCSITQKAAIAALTGPQQCVTDMLDEYRVRRDRIFEWLSVDPRIRCFKPAGAFYLFPDVSALLSLDGVRTSAELADVCSAKRTSPSPPVRRSMPRASSASHMRPRSTAFAREPTGISSFVKTLDS